MYVSPNHPDYERLKGRATAEVAPTGETLAQLVRRGLDGAEQRLRVALASYEGHRYVSIRLWEGGRPTKKGCSIRLAELPVVIAALQQALDRAGAQTPPEPTREAPPRRRQRPEPRAQWNDQGSP